MTMIYKKIDKNEESLWMIEKIIQKRKRKGVTELLVKFESWPEKFNQWIKESDIVDLSKT